MDIIYICPELPRENSTSEQDVLKTAWKNMPKSSMLKNPKTSETWQSMGLINKWGKYWLILWLLVSLILQNLPSIGKISCMLIGNWKSLSLLTQRKKKQTNRCSIIVFVFPPKWNISKIRRFRKMWAVIQWTGIFSPINLSNYATFPYLLKLLPFSLRSKTWWNSSVICTSSLPWSSSLSNYIFS